MNTWILARLDTFVKGILILSQTVRPGCERHEIVPREPGESRYAVKELHLVLADRGKFWAGLTIHSRDIEDEIVDLMVPSGGSRGMPRPLPRRLMGWWLVSLSIVLVAVGLGIGWKWARSHSDLVARSVSAYKRGDWTAAAELARARLKTEPNDVEAIRMLARATARLWPRRLRKRFVRAAGIACLAARGSLPAWPGLEPKRRGRQSRASLAASPRQEL